MSGEQVGDLTRGARIGIGVVATAAAVLSFSSLAELAHATGYTAVVWKLQVAWLLPVALDAAAGVSTFVWLRARRDEVVRLAQRLAWSTIALSVLGNGTQHALQAMDKRPGWIIAVAVGATAPAVFGAVVHLAVVASSRESVTNQPAATAPLQVKPQATTPESAGSQPGASPSSATSLTSTPLTSSESDTWGGPDAVTKRRDAAALAAPAPTPLRRRAVVRAKGRTRQELVTAGRALTPPVKRGAKESTAAFRDRVEAGERAQRDPDDDRERVPA